MFRLPAFLLLLFLALPGLTCAGCMPVGPLRPSTDSAGEMTIAPQGLSITYPQSPNVVFRAALTALPQMELTVVETDPGRRYILAEHGLSLMSNGENIGVYFAPQQGGTQVTVTCRAKTASNLFPLDYSEAVHQRLGLVLGGIAQQP